MRNKYHKKKHTSETIVLRNARKNENKTIEQEPNPVQAGNTILAAIHEYLMVQ